ncbi:hypothetical protein N483_21275 [Pseudoalteromonas luteoviolacea NCIMB 1944]|nr:hypothetical protein N483_21275 [Pseudoalteromonas luteoviolacea NCIMB 1944]
MPLSINIIVFIVTNEKGPLNQPLGVTQQSSFED